MLTTPAALANTGDGNDLITVAAAAKSVGGMLLPAIAALLLSHGVSFVQNFIGRREYKRSGVIGLLFWPYPRLPLMLLLALLGFAAATSVPALAQAPLSTAVVILLKLIADAFTLRFEHRQRTAQ